MNQPRQILAIFLIMACAMLVLNSCSSTKNVPYFRDAPDSAKFTSIPGAVFKDPVIAPDDILSITIITIDPSTSAPVNQSPNMPVIASAYSASTPQVAGFLVDRDGNVSLPIIGAVKVAGLTSYEARDLVKKKAEHYFKAPDVQLRFANFKITVLGEVAHPSTFIVPNEKVSVLDALGMAGDLTIYGKRTNILLVRENNGQKELIRLDIHSTSFLRSPYYYLKQNDVIYVEPNDAKIISTDAAQTRFVTIAASLASALLVLLIRIH